MPPARTAPRPLVVSTAEALVDDLLRLLAAAGLEACVATGGPALRAAHRDAPLVLLGDDVLDSAGVRALPRRPGVLVVAAGELSAQRWAGAVEVGAERVVVLPADEAWLVARAAAAARAPVQRGRMVVVGGSCGGAGASTLSVALALTAASASAAGVLLLDTDAWGGGLDLLLGAERAEGLRWAELAGLRGRVGGEALLAALPEVDGVHVLAADRAAPAAVPDEALAAVVGAALDAGHGVVVDAARPRPGTLPAAVGVDADLVLLVVPARLRSATAARLLVQAQDPAWSQASLVVRRLPGGLSADAVADLVGRPVLAQLAEDRSAVPRGERGEPPTVSARSPLGSVARRLLAAAGPVRR